MSKKEILFKVNSDDFIQLLNSGKIKVNSDDLKFIRSNINLNPVFKDSVISVSKKSINNCLKTTLNNHSLIFQLC